MQVKLRHETTTSYDSQSYNMVGVDAGSNCPKGLKFYKQQIGLSTNSQTVEPFYHKQQQTTILSPCLLQIVQDRYDQCIIDNKFVNLSVHISITLINCTQNLINYQPNCESSTLNIYINKNNWTLFNMELKNRSVFMRYIRTVNRYRMYCRIGQSATMKFMAFKAQSYLP